MKKANKQLGQVRDRLRVRAHLFDAELKKEWKHFEDDWYLIRSELRRLVPVAKRAVTHSTLATRPLVRRIYTSLERIQEGIERHHSTRS